MNRLDIANESPQIMGIVNVTPDSFSDGGSFYDPHKAIDHGVRLLNEGADILDIGGESTRPNAKTVSIQEEIDRVIPVIQGLADHGAPLISIDTRNAITMDLAIKAGANFVNDISGLRYSKDSASIVAQSGLPICIMHMQGNPENMQDSPKYNNVIDEILAFFDERLAYCQKQGIAEDKVILDPGLGFGKTLEHNLQIIKHLDAFHKFGCPVLLGASRKGFIGNISAEKSPKDRLAGSLASALIGLEKGARYFRVHDVKETKQAFDVHRAVMDGK